MSKKEKLTYEVKVESDQDYKIKVRIGDAQDGDHNVFGNCPYSREPVNDDPEWISILGLGSQIKKKVLYVSSATQDNNPHTNNVSVRVFVNEKELDPITGNNVLTVKDEEIAYFNQQIDFV